MQRKAAAVRRSSRACRPALSPAITGRPERRRELVVGNRHDAAARGGAVLDARDDLLADIAALVEIDAVELVHVGFVRKGVAVDEVERRRAARRARCGALRRRRHRLSVGAEIGGGFLRPDAAAA